MFTSTEKIRCSICKKEDHVAKKCNVNKLVDTTTKNLEPNGSFITTTPIESDNEFPCIANPQSETTILQSNAFNEDNKRTLTKDTNFSSFIILQDNHSYIINATT